MGRKYIMIKRSTAHLLLRLYMLHRLCIRMGEVGPEIVRVMRLIIIFHRKCECCSYLASRCAVVFVSCSFCCSGDITAAGFMQFGFKSQKKAQLAPATDSFTSYD